MPQLHILCDRGPSQVLSPSTIQIYCRIGVNSFESVGYRTSAVDIFQTWTLKKRIQHKSGHNLPIHSETLTFDIG